MLLLRLSKQTTHTGQCSHTYAFNFLTLASNVLSVMLAFTAPGAAAQRLHAQLEGGNLDPREAEKARAGQRQDYPDGIEECGTDALRFALISYTTQVRAWHEQWQLRCLAGTRHGRGVIRLCCTTS